MATKLSLRPEYIDGAPRLRKRPLYNVSNNEHKFFATREYNQSINNSIRLLSVIKVISSHKVWYGEESRRALEHAISQSWIASSTGMHKIDVIMNFIVQLNSSIVPKEVWDDINKRRKTNG